MLDGLRRRHFPSGRNVVPAHISLFHKLPGEELESIRTTLTAACAARRPFDLEPMEAISLGKGVALRYRSQELADLRSGLARSWADWLSPQDRQGFRPHVTIQNKVDPKVARALYESMRSFDPPECRVRGLSLWRYLGGPWEDAGTFPFGGSAQYGEITA